MQFKNNIQMIQLVIIFEELYKVFMDRKGNVVARFEPYDSIIDIEQAIRSLL